MPALRSLSTSRGMASRSSRGTRAQSARISRGLRPIFCRSSPTTVSRLAMMLAALASASFTLCSAWWQSQHTPEVMRKPGLEQVAQFFVVGSWGWRGLGGAAGVPLGKLGDVSLIGCSSVVGLAVSIGGSLGG